MFLRRSPKLLTRRWYSQQPTTAAVTELLAKYGDSTPLPLNLSQLLSFGRPISPDSVLSSVSYVLYELPRRLVTRVRYLESLPYIVGTNPHVARTLKNFRWSFWQLATHPPVTNLKENEAFVQLLTDLVQRHANDIPEMAKGFQECAKYISFDEVNTFLNGAIRNRISVRLIAEQHITVTQALYDPPKDGKEVGVVDTRCSPREMVDVCGSFVGDLCEATLGQAPKIVIDGHRDATFPYIPVHLEYILTELLKNSFRATVEHHTRRKATGPLPPIEITLSPPPPPLPPSSTPATATGTAAIAPGRDLATDLYTAPGQIFGAPASSYNTVGTPTPGGDAPKFFSIRIRDQGGGVSRQHLERIFSYAFTTVKSGTEESEPDLEEDMENEPFLGVMTQRTLQTGMGTIAGLGYGLPMSRLYTQYFGGSLDLISLENWGSDVYIKLKSLDEAGDSHI